MMAWFLGMPAYPAIRMDGHAWSSHEGQKTFLVFAVWAGLVWLTWRLRRNKALAIVLGAATLAYPLIASTKAKYGSDSDPSS